MKMIWASYLKTNSWISIVPAAIAAYFCFIDQMPPGMRETLYFKDDDSRLSFCREIT